MFDNAQQATAIRKKSTTSNMSFTVHAYTYQRELNDITQVTTILTVLTHYSPQLSVHSCSEDRDLEALPASG